MPDRCGICHREPCRCCVEYIDTDMAGYIDSIKTERDQWKTVAEESAVVFRADIARIETEREKWRIAASVLCGAHVGVPQAACPVCERDRLRQELNECCGCRWSDGTGEVPCESHAAVVAERDRLRAALEEVREAIAMPLSVEWPRISQAIVLDAIDAALKGSDQQAADDRAELLHAQTRPGVTNADQFGGSPWGRR